MFYVNYIPIKKCFLKKCLSYFCFRQYDKGKLWFSTSLSHRGSCKQADSDSMDLDGAQNSACLESSQVLLRLLWNSLPRKCTKMLGEKILKKSAFQSMVQTSRKGGAWGQEWSQTSFQVDTCEKKWSHLLGNSTQSCALDLFCIERCRKGRVTLGTRSCTRAGWGVKLETPPHKARTQEDLHHEKKGEQYK